MPNFIFFNYVLPVFFSKIVLKSNCCKSWFGSGSTQKKSAQDDADTQHCFQVFSSKFVMKNYCTFSVKCEVYLPSSSSCSCMQEGGLNCQTCSLEFLEAKFMEEHLKHRDHEYAAKVGAKYSLAALVRF